MRLKISPDLALPVDFVTKTAAVLAQRRKGKTYTASVIAEELVAAKQPFVALDPTGAWWGLRAAADGQKAGLPVVILGGQHGDVPLERAAGKFIADLVVDQPGFYVIDFSLFESGEAERQFAVDFAERLYRAKGRAGDDFPLHLFVDEADRFIPQQIRKGSQETSARLLGAFEAIVRRGGLRGLGTTLISQRAAVVNKNVLEMLDILFVLRTVGPNDRDAVDGYVKAHGTKEQRDELMGSLASLAIGEAWVWEPGADPPLFERVRIRERHTFNSSATPRVGEKRVEPRRLADVDLKALSVRMADTIERAKQDDPKELRRRIAELEREAKKQEPVVERVEVPVIDETAIKRLEEACEPLIHLAESVQAVASVATGLLTAVRRAKQEPVAARGRGEAFTQVIDGLGRVAAVGRGNGKPSRSSPIESVRQSVASSDSMPMSLTGLSKAERAILQALANYPHGKAQRQLGVLTGYSSKGGGFRNALSALRTKGFITRGNPIQITDEGMAAIGSDWEPLPTGPALLGYWLKELGKAEGLILEQLARAWPDAMTKEQIAAAAGYEAGGGGFRNALSRLRTLELIEGRGEMKAADALFEGASL